LTYRYKYRQLEQTTTAAAAAAARADSSSLSVGGGIVSFIQRCGLFFVDSLLSDLKGNDEHKTHYTTVMAAYSSPYGRRCRRRR
jgi:hypothetical protein